jgi:putative ribosome biogenesis GTPase RsgA
VLERRNQGDGRPQLAAANVDMLFIVTSCNADFNLARLERYLALAIKPAPTRPSCLPRRTPLPMPALINNRRRRCSVLWPWC